MQDNILIYVAGNPGLYPLEYYDSEAGGYAGAIPELLRAFASGRGYEHVYYEPGPEDNRAHLAENMQVDIISGAVSGEDFENSSGILPLFTAETEEGTVEYGLALTSAAPDGLYEELAAYAAGRSQSAVTGEILAAAAPSERPEAGPSALPALIALALAAAVAIAALLAALRRSRARARAAERELETDSNSGLLNSRGFERAFNATVNDSNHVLYHMVCFHFELGHIERVSGPGEILRFQRFMADVLRRHASGNELMAVGINGDFFSLCRTSSAAEARDWALGALKDMKTYTCAGASLRDSDASVGIFPLSAREHDYSSVLFHARQCAMSAAWEGHSWRICGGDNCRACDDEHELLSDLEHALEFGEFQLHMQFFVSAKDFSITGGEALSRWQHPKKGLLGPDRFIPLLEREGRIERLDFYNLDRACAFLQQLYAEKKGEFFLSCNFSRRSFAQPQLLERCREIICRYDFPRHELIMEITESGYINPAEAGQMRANILAVRSLGVQVMLDDFGMGYATFHDLQEFPMDGLKLDKSLVDTIDTEQGKVIVDGIVRTGHKLGLVVLAEGVEEEWQVDALKALNCDLLQGYLFSLPIPASEALRRVAGLG